MEETSLWMGKLDVKGDGYFSSDLETLGNCIVNEVLIVQNMFHANATSEFKDDVTMDKKLDVKQAVLLEGNLSVLGPSTFSSPLEAPGGISCGTFEALDQATFYEQVGMESKLDVKGNIATGSRS